ncbi:MAG: helix-hairpin-helix domain-containing protein, partial [Desulfuromonadaceae bacterium]|nr:helix-hairpin-helix domain-containing protein [Desulfuromonadaceae bacterium]
VLAGWKSPLKRYESIPSAVRYLRNGSAVNLSVQPDGSFLLAMGQMTVPERMVLGIPLDISTMSEADFIRLPGIGPALARRIIVYSQNNGGILHVEDLATIKGIGQKKYKMLSTYF